MNAEFLKNQSALTSLRKEWLVFFSGYIAFLGAGFLILYLIWAPVFAVRWTLLTGFVAGYQLWLVRKNLVFNHRIGEETLLPKLGLGNSITLTRGLLFAGLTGFLFSPRPPGSLAWIPAFLYTVGSLIDFLDGYAAREMNQVTKLGEILDMSMDGWGMLVAACLAVQYGQVPFWYILVGLARYLYLLGLWIWDRRGIKIHDLPPNNARRPFAGLQMGFAFVMLWPVFTPPGTHIAAVVFSFPFLVSFAWDWLVVSGIVDQWAGKSWVRIKPFAVEWMPLIFRAGVPLLLIWQYSYILAQTNKPIYFQVSNAAAASLITGSVFLIFDIVVPLCLLIGAAGRISAITGLIILGFHQIYSPLTPIQISLLWVYGILLYLGTGLFSVWKPEDRLIYRRAGG